MKLDQDDQDDQGENTMSKNSRFLSLVLRHKPQEVGLTLGPGGWVQVNDLLKGMKKTGRHITRDELERIVAEDNKSRYTLSEDGRCIRAAQGHSVKVNLDLPIAIPPDQLFHGTARHSLDAIWNEGIKPGRRHDVHLSSDPETATRVGARHGRAVVLTVATGKMHSDGHEFRQADNGVWLTGHVPPAYLGFHDKVPAPVSDDPTP